MYQMGQKMARLPLIKRENQLAGSLGERMRIEGDLVGIGTSAPVRKLHALDELRRGSYGFN